MFTWVSIVAFIFGSAELLKGPLKFTFVCWYAHNTLRMTLSIFFLQFSIKLANGKGIKAREPDFLGKIWFIWNIWENIQNGREGF